jgi:hypothetical protein
MERAGIGKLCFDHLRNGRRSTGVGTYARRQGPGQSLMPASWRPRDGCAIRRVQHRVTLNLEDDRKLMARRSHKRKRCCSMRS